MKANDQNKNSKLEITELCKFDPKTDLSVAEEEVRSDEPKVEYSESKDVLSFEGETTGY